MNLYYLISVLLAGANVWAEKFLVLHARVNGGFQPLTTKRMYYHDTSKGSYYHSNKKHLLYHNLQKQLFGPNARLNSEPITTQDLNPIAEDDSQLVNGVSEHRPHHFDAVVVYNSNLLPPSPILTATDGFATIETYQTVKVFGIKRDFLVFSTNVEPFNLVPDEVSLKIPNLEPFICMKRKSDQLSFLMTKDHSGKELDCVPAELFLLSMTRDEYLSAFYAKKSHIRNVENDHI